MRDDKIFKSVVNQHESAKRIFKDDYSFEVKQRDILFEINCALRKNQAEQLSDQNRIAVLTKKVDKRQVVIDKLITQLEISSSVTEEDV